MPYPTEKLESICEINPKFSNNRNSVSEVGFLTMADVSENSEIVKINKRKLSEVRKGFTNFVNGDVLVAKITPCFENGKGAFVEGMPNGIGFGSTEFHVLRTTKNLLLNKYLYYFVSDKSFRSKNATFMTGSAGQRRISTDFVKKIKIPLPPLQIQKQIVERLDKIAETQKLNDELIQKTDELFQSLLHVELNSASQNWEVKKLGDIAETSSGGTPLKEKAEYYENGTIPWLRSGEVSRGLIYKSELFITEKGLEYSSAKIFPVDTVLVAMYGATAGQVGLLKFESSTNQAICGIFPNNKFISEYLYYFLKTKTEYLIQISTGGAQPNISQAVIRNLKVPLPDLKTQKQIVAKLSAVQDYKKQLLEQKAKLKELFDSASYQSMQPK